MEQTVIKGPLLDDINTLFIYKFTSFYTQKRFPFVLGSDNRPMIIFN